MPSTTHHSAGKESPLPTHKERAKFYCRHGGEASRLESSLRWCSLAGSPACDSFVFLGRRLHPSVGREHGLLSHEAGRMANLTFVRRQHGMLSMTISTLTQLRGEAAKQGLRIGSLLNVDAQASPPRGDAYFRDWTNRRRMRASLSAIGISSQA
ncbi:uncharacterized protein BO96DRAFT_437536 [Aspergillus niger CBS 101883]|uniref:uncharacterized protein n=1 Tax=Aspergillus lacticoffeatus (strain CBS 101883) TaxID=1450533 RepID=UPI000D805694|nr:uncharacterized protein BO96DRAFT_437536 [Aspergillus niger CBS 101883]PYH52924.1 hypothetical protein BO96DRAFT_437536 [Aspergillus niger CBS 101883]